MNRARLRGHKASGLRKSYTALALLLALSAVGSSATAASRNSRQYDVPPDPNAPVIELPAVVPAFPRAVSGKTGQPIQDWHAVKRQASSARSTSLTSSTTLYATEDWDEEESLSPIGLRVYSSTAAGTTAVTGTVLSDAGDPVIGATVTLRPSSGVVP